MNILIHALLYPEYVSGKRPNTTLFIHYYAAEWARQGHRVLVIHHKAVFPRLVVALCGLYAKTPLPLSGRVRDYLDGYGVDEDAEFTRDGVEVVRRSIVKPLPRLPYSRRSVQKRARLCRDILKEKSFTPDVVLADFLNPCLYVAEDMAQGLVGCALHDTDMGYISRFITRKSTLRALSRADFLGFRSEAQKQAFLHTAFSPKRSLLMPSGLPAALRVPARARERVRSFLCAGRMVTRKHMDVVIRAFGLLNRPDAALTLVGNGVEEAALRALAKEQPHSEHIYFAGRKTREETLAAMAQADCFALLSQPETFGMVYVEAMSTGAIPIAARGEGGEAFIRDGETGFLLEPGDAEGLAARMGALMDMDGEKVSEMSRRAEASVRPLRDDKLAQSAAEAFARWMQETKA